MRNCGEIFHATNLNVCILTIWYSACQVWEIGNCEILFKRLLHKNGTVPRVIS